jgi:prophage DNA circulation protein
MSWVEKVKSDFIITCGDGKSYKPLWIKATKSKEYNISEFEFPNLPGTLVSRGEPKGRRYELEIFFQGDDHLDQSEAFEASADDKRAWNITHPFYGNIIVQPTGLYFDNTSFNVTRIVGTVIETITEDYPRITVAPVDKIQNQKADLDEIFIKSFDIKPSTTDINLMQKNNALLYKQGVKGLKLTVDAERYFNAFNNANAAIINATSEPLKAIRQLQAVINAPFLFQESVRNRLNMLLSQFNLLRQSISGLVKKAEKRIYENNQGVLVSSMAVGAVTNYEYQNRNEVYQTIEIILDSHNQYLADLDSLQSANGGNVDSYIPDVTAITELNSLVNYTVSNLFSIALDSKQERTYICEDDTDIITLTHRFYGLTPDDSTIEELVRNNEIGLDEILGIRKGRKIIYYI